MNKIKIILLPFFYVVITSLNCYSQNDTLIESVKIEKLSNYYFRLSLGLNNPIYRDFATSPLFYKGYGVILQTSWYKSSDLRERSFEIGLGLSSLAAKIPESNFIQPATSSIFGQFNIRYFKLWKLKSLSSERYNIKIGGIIQSTQNLRLNQSLQNNAFGIENISNILVSGQIKRDISRKVTRQLNFWFFKPKLKPINRDLRFQFNAGIFNFNYRPGYAYSYDGEINGIESNPVEWIFSNYKWSLNGWRFNTELEYITYLLNGNARGWSYIWDAANAPGRHEKFQMACHQIRYTYYFQTKKR